MAALAGYVALTIATISPALAAATQNDLLVAARALGFMENGPKGQVIVGVVYDPDNTKSTFDAAGVEKFLAMD